MSPLLLNWIRLSRFPAVLTVPGDVWVGAALAGQELSISKTLSVALLYLFGMVFNDLVDEPRDRENKSKRPLPDGQISKTAAWVCCFLLVNIAFLLQSGVPMFVLLFLIISYNLLKNSHVLIGALLMASCRCAVLWMGAGAPAVGTALVLLFVVWGLIIIGITLMAERENKGTSWSTLGASGMTLLWLAAPLVALGLGKPRYLVFLPWALIALLGYQNFVQIKAQGEMHPRNTGLWLSMLIPLQAAFLFALAPIWQGGVILCLWPLLRWSIQKIKIS